MTHVDADVVIVGSGHGGTQLASSLAAEGGRAIVLIGDEPEYPYDRPSLSKAYLQGEVDLDGIRLRNEEFWTSSGVRTMFGRRVASLDAERHVVSCEDGTTVGYRWLVWAAGGRARGLPKAVARAEYSTLRSLGDVERLKPQLDRAAHVTVIGGGYVGLEAAAVVRSMGKAVTVVEAAPRLLARVTGPVVSQYVADKHRDRGVALRLGASVRSFARDDSGIDVILEDGDRFTTDLVIAGIGMLPNVEVLEAAGASVDEGVVVDSSCRTSLPDVFAVGDCTRHQNRFANGAATRLECVQNAVDQAKVVHGVLDGTPTEYDAVPWFWSNQYEMKLKSAGLVHCADSSVVRGDTAGDAFSVVYLRDERVVAVDSINVARDFMAARQLIGQRALVDVDAVADPTVELRKAVRVNG